MIHTSSPVPQFDPTALLDEFRASALSQLLVAGVTSFDVGKALESGPLPYPELCRFLRLGDRPATVLMTALRSLGLIDVTADHLMCLTPYGREKIAPSSSCNLRGYIGLGAFSADTQAMIECLRNDRPAGNVSFVYHETAGPSALDDPEISDSLTRAMAARASNVAPSVARCLDLSSSRHLVDIGGAHGLYSFELLRKHTLLSASIIDRAPPLKVASEYAAAAELSERVHLIFGDIHGAELPASADVVLMANILHDYNLHDASNLVRHFAEQLPSGGKLIILDAFLDSVPHDGPPVAPGPREVAAYSGMLFSICEGRCYRQDEFEKMLTDAGLRVEETVHHVPCHGRIMTGVRRN
ncbi:MAG: hypothetical protein KDA81_03785 [Planctomycetaceae bacterium]|nr:hypothetical protein [Planctomycetaceae bacterium]